MRRLAISIVLLVGAGIAQETSLGDIARQLRARKDAAELANFKPGVPPPIAQQGDTVPAHFITISGDAGKGEFTLKVNGEILFHNSYVRDLPIYISTLLLDGGNTLDVSFTSGESPVDMKIEERLPREADHRILGRFHSDPTQTPAPVAQQVKFIAHPKALPPLELGESDRAAIRQAVQVFYEALRRKDGKQVLGLFAPAIADARVLYPEGADFGQSQLNRMAEMVSAEGFEMEMFDATGLEMTPKGATVIVRHSDGKPVFASSEVKLSNGTITSISAETIPLKKIAGRWQLTLPFGF